MKAHVFRLTEGKDLREEINKYSKNNKVKAGCILSCVGNLKKVVLRMADGKTIKKYEDKTTYEIISLSGTLEKGNSHLHLSISDSKGKVFGGHLKEGTIVGLTAEIVLGEIESKKFFRKFDKRTGYKELVIH